MSPGIKAGLGAAALLAVLCPIAVHAQGFGKTRRKVVLHRKLPAIAHLTGTTFNVRVTAREARQSKLAATMTDVLEAEIIRNNPRLNAEKTGADTLVSCTINTLSTPPPTPVKRNVIDEQKIGKDMRKASQQRTFQKVSGTLAFTYQARNKAGQVLDTDNITVKFAQEYDDETGGAASKSWFDVVKRPIRKILPGSDEEGMPQNAAELEQVLLSRAAAQVAMRLVNTNVPVTVYLAHGKGLDPAVKLAENGLYSRMLESLESMPPFTRPEDDAYRVYDIGVAYEALAYQAEDPKATSKFLEEAAIHYGKAFDARPEEKFFAQPQQRIGTAIAHFRKLQAQSAEAAQPTPAPGTAAAATAASATTPAKDRSAKPASGRKSSAPPKKSLSDVLSQ